MVPGVDNFGGWYDGGTGNDLVYMGPHYGKAPRIYDYNVTVQKEYKGWLLEGAYVGNRGHGTNSSAIMNTLPLSLLYLGTAGPAGATNLLTTKITSSNICNYSSAIGCTNGVPNLPFSTFVTGWGSSATLSQALRQYPQYDSITYNNSGDGRTWYDAMQFKAEHRFGDLNLQGSYVYSKNLAMLSYQQVGSGGSYSTQGAQDDYNPYADKSYSYYDIPNFVNVVASYKLPFGRDKKFLHSANPIVNHLIGNWTVAWDQQYRSGTLSQILSPTNNLGNGGAFQKATSTGLPIRTNVSSTDIVPNNPNTRWFNYGTGGNALPYKQTPAFTLGSASYFNPAFRQPWYRYESMSLNKQFHIRESVLMNYEVNFYNIFNRTDFGGITTSLSSAAFGESTGAQAGPRNITMGLRLEF
jgi:hypothetical protein